MRSFACRSAARTRGPRSERRPLLWSALLLALDFNHTRGLESCHGRQRAHAHQSRIARRAPACRPPRRPPHGHVVCLFADNDCVRAVDNAALTWFSRSSVARSPTESHVPLASRSLRHLHRRHVRPVGGRLAPIPIEVRANDLFVDLMPLLTRSVMSESHCSTARSEFPARHSPRRTSRSGTKTPPASTPSASASTSASRDVGAAGPAG